MVIGRVKTGPCLSYAVYPSVPNTPKTCASNEEKLLKRQNLLF